MILQSVVDDWCGTDAAKKSAVETAHGTIEDWDVSRITNMNNLFLSKASFNNDLSKWDVSKVITLKHTFYDANAFNSDLSAWDVSKVTTLYGTFYNAQAFNSDLTKWDISSVLLTQRRGFAVQVTTGSRPFGMFLNGAMNFTENTFFCDGLWSKLYLNLVNGKRTDFFFHPGDYDMSKDLEGTGITDFSCRGRLVNMNVLNAVDDYCGSNDTKRNIVLDTYGAIESWDTSRITNMGKLFEQKDYFNDDISKWNTSGVTNMAFCT